VTIGLILSSDYDSLWGAFRDATFAVVSLGTSTGFATVDTSVWPLFSILVLVYMMIQCGCSGSTSGGIKADRVWILYKSIKAQLLRTLHPNAVVSVKYGETVADRDLLTSITTYVILYVVLVFLFGLAYAAIGLDLPDSLSASISMLSNVGPGFGSIGSLENFAHIPAFGRFLMSFEMIFGRLGIYSLLIFYVLANVRRS
jgi:trk system potassium uptake protein TrkH